MSPHVKIFVYFLISVVYSIWASHHINEFRKWRHWGDIAWAAWMIVIATLFGVLVGAEAIRVYG